MGADTSVQPATRRPRRAVHKPSLALLIASHVVVDFHQGAVPAMLPFLVAARQYDYAAAAGITLAATLLSSLVQPAFGALTDRRRMPWLVGVGPVVAGVGIGLSGLLDSYAFTWAAVAFSGIGVAAFHPEATAAARRVSGGSATGLSMFSVGGFIGLATGPLLTEPVLDTTGVPGTVYLAVPGACAAVVVLPLWRWLRKRHDAVGAAARVGRTGAVLRNDWRSFGWLTASVVTRSVVHFGMTAFLALHLIHDLGASTSVGSAGLTTFLAAGAVGTILGGVLGDRFGRVRTMRIGYLGALPGLVGLVVAPDLPLAFAAIVVLGLTSMIPFAVQVTLGQEYLPARVGTASGVTLGVGMTIGGMATPLLGMLADARGLPVTLAVLVVFPLLAWAFSLRLRDVPTG